MIGSANWTEIISRLKISRREVTYRYTTGIVTWLLDAILTPPFGGSASKGSSGCGGFCSGSYQIRDNKFPLRSSSETPRRGAGFTLSEGLECNRRNCSAGITVCNDSGSIYSKIMRGALITHLHVNVTSYPAFYAGNSGEGCNLLRTSTFVVNRCGGCWWKSLSKKITGVVVSSEEDVEEVLSPVY